MFIKRKTCFTFVLTWEQQLAQQKPVLYGGVIFSSLKNIIDPKLIIFYWNTFSLTLGRQWGAGKTRTKQDTAGEGEIFALW